MLAQTWLLLYLLQMATSSVYPVLIVDNFFAVIS